MNKCQKLERRSGNYGREFLAFMHKKASVPLGCVLANIRCVPALADMNNYLSRAAPCRLSRQNSNAIVK